MDHQYTTIEHQQIIQDLEQSKRVAIEEGDNLKLYYLNND